MVAPTSIHINAVRLNVFFFTNDYYARIACTALVSHKCATDFQGSDGVVSEVRAQQRRSYIRKNYIHFVNVGNVKRGITRVQLHKRTDVLTSTEMTMRAPLCTMSLAIYYC